MKHPQNVIVDIRWYEGHRRFRTFLQCIGHPRFYVQSLYLTLDDAVKALPDDIETLLKKANK